MGAQPGGPCRYRGSWDSVGRKGNGWVPSRYAMWGTVVVAGPLSNIESLQYGMQADAVPHRHRYLFWTVC